MANYCNPSDYLEGGDSAAERPLEFAEREANQLARAATAYQGRNTKNTIEPEANDIPLHDVLRQIDRETDPLKREALEAKAMQLASGSAVRQQRRPRQAPSSSPVETFDPSEINGSKSVMTTPYGVMQQKYGRQEIQEALQWASTELDDSTVDVLNSGLNSKNINDVEKAFKLLSTMKANNITSLKKSK